jgi:hypothetical protein
LNRMSTKKNEELVSKGLVQAWNLTLSVGLRRTANGMLCSGWMVARVFSLI